MSIRLVTHCYAARLPQYAKHLWYQLSSLVLHKPDVPVAITICYSMHDATTTDTILKFEGRHGNGLSIRPMSMSGPELYRRSIGRNRAGLEATEDLIWFTDVDHVFGEGCLDNLWRIWQGLKQDEISMVYPKAIKIHQDHATGDATPFPASEDWRLLEINSSEFVDKRYRRAIGGVQIARGDLVRQYGYLNGHSKYQKPRLDGLPFGDFRDDIVFRGRCKTFGKIVGIDLANLYRIRHSETTYQ